MKITIMWDLLNNQPAKLYSTAKTHKFENLKNIIPQNFKCCPIIHQMGTCTYKAAKFISNWLKTIMSKRIFHLRYSAISRYAFKFITIIRWWKGCFL